MRKHADKRNVPIETAPEGVAGDQPVTTPSAEMPTLTAEAVDSLKAQAAKAAEHWDKLLRTTADFENYKKRAARERSEAEAGAQARLLLKFIPVLDNFEMALAATATATDAAGQSLQAGVQMIAQQFRAALTEAGLEEIDATGKPFDPNFHEAVSQQESDEVPEGHVLQQLRKGYKLRDRLLRPATVVVARKPASDGSPAPASA